MITKDIHKMRREYIKDGLTHENLLKNPFEQFNHWFEQALKVIPEEANAVTLATVSEDGQPAARTVLLKFYDHTGMVFYTNYESRKATEMDANPKVALLIYWSQLERQIRIEGRAEKVSTTESVKYFLSRPRGSQLGAWCSNQSGVISSREMLMSKFKEIKNRFKNKDVTLPSFWGGYRVVPESFEFWQGRENRLHDRFRFTNIDEESWNIHRLAP